jgi:hypothetical protein
MHQHLAPVRLLNKIIQHALGDFEIGDHAVFHRLDSHDVAGRPPQHFLGFLADRFHFPVGLVDGHDGRFVDHDPFALGKDEGIGGAQIDGKVRGK